jgi:hypothetical protein
MSLLLEIANRADVPLEAVVRVLTREPVSDAVKSRVLEVLDDLEPEETRVLQRFALAAVHDVLPRPGEPQAVEEEPLDDSLELPEKVVLELEAGWPEAEEEDAEAEEVAPAALPATIEAAPLVQLGSVLGELTEAVRELRHETDAERRERVDDLAVLIDLITKGWEGVDRRLGRVERQLGRLESAPRAAAIPARVEPPPVRVPVPGPDAPPPPPPPEAEAGDDPARSTLRQRLPIIAALAFGIAIGAVAALDLPSRLDASAVIADRGSAEAAQRAQLPVTVADQTGSAVSIPQPATTAPEDTPPARTLPAPKPKPPARTAPAATTQSRPVPPTAPATTEAATQPATQAATQPARTTTQARTTAPPRTTTAPARPPGDFTPSRNWAWPPVAGADYYLVEFFRAGQPLYRARPTEARLTLPDSIEFTPGIYRWRVRPGHGAAAANQLDPPVVDSEFVLSR